MSDSAVERASRVTPLWKSFVALFSRRPWASCQTASMDLYTTRAGRGRIEIPAKRLGIEKFVCEDGSGVSSRILAKANRLMLRRKLVDLMNIGFWIVLAMVVVMIGGLVGYMVATFTSSLVWAIPLGI